MDLKGSRTERNILTAFAGESQARNRYTYFASQAKKEGFAQIQAIFEETANQEKEHAKRLFKLLQGGMVEVSASFPPGSSARRRRTSRRRRAASTTSGPRCIPASRRWPAKRASPRSP